MYIYIHTYIYVYIYIYTPSIDESIFPPIEMADNKRFFKRFRLRGGIEERVNAKPILRPSNDRTIDARFPSPFRSLDDRVRELEERKILLVF